MNKLHNWVNTSLIVIVGILVLVGGNQSDQIVGSSGSRFPHGISADTTSPVEGEVRGTTLNITSTAAFAGQITANAGLLQSSVNSTTTGATVTLLQADLLGYTSLLITPIVSDSTITLPASSTLTTFIPNAGDRVSMAVVNASTTAGIDVIFVEGTGTLLRSATTTKTILQDSIGILDFVRKANTDVEVYFNNGTSF